MRQEMLQGSEKVWESCNTCGRSQLCQNEQRELRMSDSVRKCEQVLGNALELVVRLQLFSNCIHQKIRLNSYSWINC